jgi:hypothetical protein
MDRRMWPYWRPFHKSFSHYNLKIKWVFNNEYIKRSAIGWKSSHRSRIILDAFGEKHATRKFLCSGLQAFLLKRP